MEMEKEIKILSLDDILPNRFQPRIKFHEKAILELAESIKKHGVIQPIVVRELSDKYEIIAGERRYKASLLAGKTTIPAIVTSLDDKNSAEVALIENVQRENLTPIEEAISYRKILDMGYMNQTELADKLGKTQSTIANKLRLLNLEEEVQEALMDGKISERHARSLLRLSGRDQVRMLDQIIKERLTVRATDKAIEKLVSQKSLEDEIEILDFDEDTEGDNSMNHPFNIPNSPIIGDDHVDPQPVTTPIPEVVKEESEIIPDPIMDLPVYEENPANPGFMDVDKIATEAQDIYTPPRKEADLDALLTSTRKEEPAPIVPPAPEKEESTGKFFNMFHLNNEPEENPNFVENLEKKETNMDFGIPTPDANFNPFQFEATPSVPKVEEPVIEKPELESSSPFSMGATTDFSQPSVVPEVEEPSYDVPVFPASTPSTPMVEPDYNFNFDEDEDTTIQPSVYQLNEDDVFSPPVMEEPVASPKEIVVPTVSEGVTPPLKDAIRTIRDCAQTLEQLGFVVNLEELDFENHYQVTFQINK